MICDNCKAVWSFGFIQLSRSVDEALEGEMVEVLMYAGKVTVRFPKSYYMATNYKRRYLDKVCSDFAEELQQWVDETKKDEDDNYPLLRCPHCNQWQMLLK